MIVDHYLHASIHGNQSYRYCTRYKPYNVPVLTPSPQANIKALEAAVELGKSESDALENNFNTKLNAEVQRMGEVQKVVQQELEEKVRDHSVIHTVCGLCVTYNYTLLQHIV